MRPFFAQSSMARWTLRVMFRVPAVSMPGYSVMRVPGTSGAGRSAKMKS